MPHSGNEDILKDQAWFCSCELPEWDFHSVVFKQWGDLSERIPKAACFAMFNLGLSRNFSVGKLFFKYFTFLYEKYCSLFMVSYHGLGTCPLEYHHWMSTWRAFSYQQHCSHAELSTEFMYCQLSEDYWFQKTFQCCESAVSWLASVQPTDPFPLCVIQQQPETSSLGFWLKVPTCGTDEPWSIVDIKLISQDSWTEPGYFDLSCFKSLYQNVFFIENAWLFFPCDLYSDTIFFM